MPISPFLSSFNKPHFYWVSVDLHVHSVYSGGSSTPAEILNLSRTALLDAVAISDHHEVRGALEGQTIKPEICWPQLITAQEVSAGDHLHLLLIGSREALPETNRVLLAEAVQRHHRAGGAVVLAHPWTMPKNSWAREWLLELIIEGCLDAMEFFNSSILELTRENSYSLRALWEEWAVPYNLAVTGGSDYHYVKKGRRIGAGRTYLKVSRPGEKGVLEALQSKRSVAGLFDCRRINLEPFGMGESLYLGGEPWLQEVKNTIVNLRDRILRHYYDNPFQEKFLLNLLDTGHFNRVAELLC